MREIWILGSITLSKAEMNDVGSTSAEFQCEIGDCRRGWLGVKFPAVR